MRPAPDTDPIIVMLAPLEGVFNKRYHDVYDPAVRAAGLEPYRVDFDPATDEIIDKIRSGIRDAVVCLADISIDNPNVFYELGGAHLIGKDVVMVCDRKHRPTKIPFDVAHRAVILYESDSSSDFVTLQKAITDRLVAISKRVGDITELNERPLVEVEGLDPLDLTMLVIVTEYDEGASFWTLSDDMTKAGFTKVAARLALKRLRDLNLVGPHLVESRDGSFDGYATTADGLAWLRRNMDKIKIRRDQPMRRSSDAQTVDTAKNDDEPPF